MMAVDSRPSRAFPKPPPPRLCPEVQLSRPGDAEHRGANQGSSPAGWLGPDPTVWTPLENQPRLDCYCPRGNRYPLSTEQRQDTSNVFEEDSIFVAASTRDPWAHTMEGEGIDFSVESLVFPDEDSEDAMSEVTSECPNDYLEDYSGAAELPREKRTREECLDFSDERRARRRFERRMRKRSMGDQLPPSDKALASGRLRPEPRQRDPWGPSPSRLVWAHARAPYS